VANTRGDIPTDRREGGGKGGEEGGNKSRSVGGDRGSTSIQPYSGMIKI